MAYVPDAALCIDRDTGPSPSVSDWGGSPPPHPLSSPDGAGDNPWPSAVHSGTVTAGPAPRNRVCTHYKSSRVKFPVTKLF